jgi:hypothetical protein
LYSKLKELSRRTTFIRVTQQINEVFGSRDESKDSSSSFQTILNRQSMGSASATAAAVGDAVDARLAVKPAEEATVKRQRTYM